MEGAEHERKGGSSELRSFGLVQAN
jgi:hypothetical protein